MSKKYLDSNGLLYFWQKIKNTFALKSDVPGPATASPKMDGTTAIGSSAKYAREDHVHPTDTSRVPTTRTVNGHALSANVTVTKGDVGLGNVDNTADASKKVASAGKLTAAANIDGVDFDGSADVVRYGVCSTDAGTAAKTVTLEGSTPFKLVTGASVFVKFSSTNTAAVASLTLNVNGTGAKAIKRYGTTNMATPGNLTEGMVCQFVYDGTNWLWVGHVDTIKTYPAATTSADGLMSVNDKKKVTTMNCFFNSTTTGGKTNYSLATVSSTGAVVEASKTYFYSRNDIDGMKGAANGLCPLDSSSKINSAYLPSYVDDVIEAYARSGQEALSQNWLATGSASGTVIVPEAGKIYVLMADSGDYSANSQFRWSGTAYVKLNDGGVSEITNSEIDTIVAS